MHALTARFSQLTPKAARAQTWCIFGDWAGRQNLDLGDVRLPVRRGELERVAPPAGLLRQPGPRRGPHRCAKFDSMQPTLAPRLTPCSTACAKPRIVHALDLLLYCMHGWSLIWVQTINTHRDCGALEVDCGVELH